VTQNSCVALDLTRQAATQGVPVAVGNLGAAYENGIAGGLRCMLARDRVEALELYRKAARMGNSYAVRDAARLETVLKNETASLASSKNGKTKECTVIAGGAALYDANLNRSATTLTRGETEFALAMGDDFAMVWTLGSVLGSFERFVRTSEISCNQRLLW
jgi:TPR repeat protein